MQTLPGRGLNGTLSNEVKMTNIEDQIDDLEMQIEIEEIEISTKQQKVKILPKLEQGTNFQESTSYNPKGDGKRIDEDNIPRPNPKTEYSDQNLLQSEYIPRKSNQQVTILDLDCTLEPDKLIDVWYSQIMVAMITNNEIIKSEANSWNYVLDFSIHALSVH
ncbi:Hypothetical predicted protein [Olea europaea subsp. europaea]|uniref:Uncharacterized protein n=1 Tax=Olea europaea subsp. europaea TaxID=158383 RepID=A0A8S0URC9_OLEEU|nr:Hypothetical predicted protein [Olea europaea subsp. europaea]